MIRFFSVTYTHPNGVVALKDVNLEIRPKEITAIVGSNGAGKSTLVKHILGLLKPNKGSVTVFDNDTQNTSVAQLSKRIGIVFQNPEHQLFSDSVANEISFGLRNFGFKEEAINNRIKWALESFNLSQYRDISPLMLSSGEKKRLCIAAVLAWGPDVIIFDEPTAGQDFAQKEHLEQIIRMLNSQDKTIIIVTHDIEFIWPLSPRVIVMAGGKIVADDHAYSVFKNNQLISEASIVKPQLLEFLDLLKEESKEPLWNIHQARRWLLSKMEVS
jgi:energy-coupling factor transport system ATP-binding protein